MRIGIIGMALDNQTAGIHYFLKNLLKSLANDNSNHEFFLLRIDDEKQFDFDKIHTTVIKRRGFIGKFCFIFSDVSKWAAQNDLDIVLEPAHFGPFNLPKHIKRVTFIHDLTPILNSRWQPILSSWLQKMFLPRVIAKADLILTNSSFTKSEITKYYKTAADKISVAHLGISERFKPTANSQVLGRYGIHKEYFLFLGTIEPRKNIETLIKAYESYREIKPDSQTQLIIAGNVGWKSRKVIKAKYESQYNDDIILLGYVNRDDMPALYSGAKAFVYPSLYEGFGLPVLEAMACRTIVFTSNVSSIPEIGGRHPIYFNPEDSSALTECMLKIGSNNDEETLKSQIVHAQSFTWVKTSEKVIRALERLN